MVAVPVSGDVSLLVDKPIATVLVVDDLADNLSLMSSLLKDHYRVKVANQGEKGLRIAAQLPAPDLILLDIMMPGMDGYEVCRRLKADPATRDIPVIFLTARADVADEALGLALGAVDYITKPISPPILLARVQTHLALKATADFLRSKSDYLQQEVALRTLEVQAIQDVTIMVMAALAETRDSETGNHIRRTQLYVKALAERLREHPRFEPVLSERNIELLYKSAPLHDIGKVGIPDAILLKPGKLTVEEFEVMKRHPEIGRDAIEEAERRLGIKVKFLTFAKEIAYSHQEKWDGSGYPQGLAGDAIPVSARLMAVADVYDALISKRVYKPAFSHEQACQIVVQGRASTLIPTSSTPSSRSPTISAPSRCATPTERRQRSGAFSERGVALGCARGCSVGRGVAGFGFAAFGGGAVLAQGLAQGRLFTGAGKLAVLAQDGDQLAIDAGVAGQAFLLFQEVGFTGEIADQAAGFGHQQRARSDVPGRQTGFEEAVAETGGHIGQVQGGGAGAAQAGGAGHDVGHHGQVGLEVVARAEGEAGGDQRLTQAGALAHADAALVQVGATALGGGEQVVAAGVVDDGLFDLAAHRQRDADAVHGKTVDEVGGAVERIDDPDEFRVFGAMRLARFLGQDAVARVGREKGLDDDVLGRLIDFRHKVIHLLLRDAHGFDIECRAVDDGASGACGLDGHVEHGVQVG